MRTGLLYANTLIGTKDLSQLDSFAQNLVEAELLRRKREKVCRDIMLLASRSKKAEEVFPDAYNHYVTEVFMGYPELQSKWRIPTQGEKTAQAEDLYRDIFGDDPVF